MDYSEPCKYSIRLIAKLKSLDTTNVLDFNLINKAIYFAKKYHEGQLRKSGEPFYSHPLEVAYMISDYNLKTDVIAASILHDIIEDTPVTAGMILDNFSWRIAEMVDRLTRDRPDGSKLSVEQMLDNIYKLEDEEVLLIKLFDRLHNLLTINSLPQHKIKTIYEETLVNFLVIAILFENKNIENLISEKYYNKKLKSGNKDEQKNSMPLVLDDAYLLSLIFENDLHLEEIEPLKVT
jgi:(p)ppGpp synthase/HD superfamily hydrolase